MLESLNIFSELVTWALVWPDDIITGVTDHEKLITHNSDLTKMTRLYDNTFSLATAQKDQLLGPKAYSQLAIKL